MSQPFLKEEVSEAVHKMKNNRSPSINQVKVELIKYAPNCIHGFIAEIYNEVAKTGIYPSELNDGVLCPLQKSELKIGQLENLRPIILHSTLRKILSIIMMKRIKELTKEHHNRKQHIAADAQQQSMFLQ